MESALYGIYALVLTRLISDTSPTRDHCTTGSVAGGAWKKKKKKKKKKKTSPTRA